MSRSLSLMTALALVAGLSAGGAASAATQCRDAQGHFAKCAATSAPAKTEKCRDAKGHYAKCTSTTTKATTTAMAAKTSPASKTPAK